MKKIVHQIILCLILGIVVVTLGQACGKLEAISENQTDATSSGGGGGTPSPGQICPPGSTLPICQTGGGGGGNANAFGFANTVSALGTISGEAKNPAALTTPVTVYFFINGPQGTGTSAGSILANQPSLGNQGGANRFVYTLPTEFRNGVTRQLYIYTMINGVYQQLGGSPQTYTAYTPTAAGQAYYESTVRPQLQTRCQNCHGVLYAGHYANLLNPTKAGGGTALNNELINKMAGMNHGGGNFCGGGKNAAPCSLIQQWWNLEFN